MMNSITTNTKLIALLGYPLGQSVSAASHNRVYEKKSWDCCYLPVEVTNPENLGNIIDGIRHMNFAGFAVTKPYKIAVMKYLDDADEMTRLMGSCNTVVVQEDGSLKGYNTDGLGALRSIQEETGVEIPGNTFLCFGAGGAGKSICMELALHKAGRIYISDFETPCRELAEQINRISPETAVALPVTGRAAVREAAEQCGVMMNLSGLGMYGHLDETPLEEACFLPRQICFDATYNPARTRFLREAEEAGCTAVNGLGMLVYQATRQIALWTGHEEPVAEMREAMSEAVGNVSCGGFK